jgi:hypothetical protein
MRTINVPFANRAAIRRTACGTDARNSRDRGNRTGTPRARHFADEAGAAPGEQCLEIARRNAQARRDRIGREIGIGEIAPDSAQDAVRQRGAMPGGNSVLGISHQRQQRTDPLREKRSQSGAVVEVPHHGLDQTAERCPPAVARR